MEDVDTFLEHWGVMGMHWGVRKDADGPSDVNRQTNKDARKDAAEFARAKMFYGDGAGTRRKLIKAKVEAKSAKSAEYKKAFDYHIDRQDMEEHTNKAQAERGRKDLKNNTLKTARGVKNTLLGNPQAAGVVTFAVTTLGVAAYKAGLHKKAMSWGKVAYMKATKSSRANHIRDLYNAGKLL